MFLPRRMLSIPRQTNYNIRNSRRDFKIVVYSYLRECTSEINIEPDNGTVTKQHGGGDKGCLEAFVDAVRNNDPSLILSDGEVSLESHLMVFAAEASRKYRKLINMAEWRFYQ